MARDTHDRAGPVAHQHVVAHVDGDPRIGIGGVQERVQGIGPGGDPGLLLGEVRAVQLGLHGGLLPVGVHGGALLRARDHVDQGVLGREHHEGDPVQRVGPGREHLDADVVPLDREADLRPLGAADPLALHGLDRLRPVQPLEVVDEPVRVGRDPQHPLLEGAAHARVVPALTAPVDHLLVGEDRLELLAPPDGDLGLVDEATVVEPGEDPLRPAVVVGRAGRELTVPVVAEADRLHLAPEGGDVRLRGHRGVLPGLDRVLLGRQPERVVPHGVQDVEALHPLPARDDVGADVADGVPDVEPRPGGVGEHVEHVVLGALRVEALVPRPGGAEGPVLQPVLLPAGLELARFVSLTHGEGGGARTSPAGLEALRAQRIVRPRSAPPHSGRNSTAGGGPGPSLPTVPRIGLGRVDGGPPDPHPLRLSEPSGSEADGSRLRASPAARRKHRTTGH